jgi:regulator of nucleoside diphosphate kinase
MIPSPQLTVSSLDLARLEALLSRPAMRDSATADALWGELARAQVLPPEAMPANVVTMNSRVRFALEPSGKEFELDLKYPDDTAADGAISILAPVGSALLGLAVGQRIEWPLPTGGRVGVRILAVTYQPEAAGDFEL